MSSRLHYDENIHRGNDPEHGPYYPEWADADGRWHKHSAGPQATYADALRVIVESRRPR